MLPAAFNLYCSQFQAATHCVQWGNSEVWKIGAKVFAIGSQTKALQPAYTFKTSALNYEFLCQSEGYIPAPYLASRGLKWIQQISTDDKLDEALRYYIAESFRLVSAGLSKRQQSALGLR